MAATRSELLWIQQLLKDFGVTQPSTAVLFCDIQAASHISSNPSFHERTKNIEIDLHFVHDHIKLGSLKLLSIRTQDQLTDPFTKPLPAPHFRHLQCKMSSHIFFVDLEGEY